MKIMPKVNTAHFSEHPQQQNLIGFMQKKSLSSLEVIVYKFLLLLLLYFIKYLKLIKK